MTLSTPPVLTQLKLDYLRARRDELRARYRALEDTVIAGDHRSCLDAYARLASFKSGTESLHPDAAIFADVLAVDPDGVLTHGSVDVAARLARELATGRARAEYTWVFAELVKQWALAHAGPAEELPADTGGVIVGRALPVDLALVDAVFASHPEAWAAVAAQLQEFDREDASEYVSSSEAESVLEEIAGAPYRSEAQRREARAVAKDETLVGEYAGALTLLFDALDTWRWPEAGVPVRVVRAEDKLRHYLDDDLLTVVFVELIAERWAHVIQRGFREHVWSVFDVPAPALQHLRELLDREAWNNSFGVLLSKAGGSSHYTRADAVLDEADAICRWFTAVHQRIHALHALEGRPVHVLVTDIAAFGPSLSHELIDRVLEGIGMPARWRALIARFLAVPVHTERGVEPCRRGIYPDHRLGMVMAEVVMSLVDLAVYQRTGVVPVRLVDDIALISDDPDALRRAWAVLREVLTGFGLAVRDDRTVATTVLGDHPADLPAGPVTIGHLHLQPDGSWRIDDDAVATARTAIWAAVESAPSVLDAVNRFSDRARATMRKLIPFAPLGGEHVSAIGRRFAALFDDLGGPGRGLIPALKARIAATLPGCDVAAIPDAVWFWPRTAGGMGLYDVAAQLAALHAHRRTLYKAPPVFRRRVPTKGADVVQYEHEWTRLLAALEATPKPRQPEYTIELGARIADFVIRGQQIYGKDVEDQDLRKLRHDLTFYWQWVIAIRGQGLLDALGTFRFIEVARIPLATLIELGWLGS
jgi:hypothetical protein